MKTSKLLSLFLLGAACSASYASDAQVSVIVGGQISPGVYGSVQVVTAPHRRVLHKKSVIVVRPARAVVPARVRPHAPLVHAQHWAHPGGAYRHYGQRVHFLRSATYERGHGRKMRMYQDGARGRGKGRGHGRRG
ncbi:MAG: hypothetical protein OEM00_02290 [Burkholderiaceae bacterium]|nr:hypothetical protein [Burkholderiaceae bacterium]MDH3459804.1 hypothetical protein [Burkholderiaceae bacterium]